MAVGRLSRYRGRRSVDYNRFPENVVELRLTLGGRHVSMLIIQGAISEAEQVKVANLVNRQPS